MEQLPPKELSISLYSTTLNFGALPLLGLIFVVNTKLPRATYHTMVPSTEEIYCLNSKGQFPYDRYDRYDHCDRWKKRSAVVAII